MEFEAFISGKLFHFSALNNQTFLVSGNDSEYILYNYSNYWKCADEIDPRLLLELGKEIDARLGLGFKV